MSDAGFNTSIAPASAALFVSGALIFGYDIWALAARRKVGLALAIMVAIVLVVFRLSLGILGICAVTNGALAMRWLPPGFTWYEVAAGIGALAGLWVAAISVQLIENVALHVLGKPPQRIQWWRTWKAKPARRSKPVRGATD